jgi:hypothetical protein
MSVPPILREVYREYLAHFGEPAHSIVYDDGKVPEGYPSRVDVFVWEPDEECEMCTFATIGMSAVPLPKAKHRAELHFAVRRALGMEEIGEVTRFLANLAMYPFQTGEPLNWWHTLSNPGKIPLYTSTGCLLLHPRFAGNGWDRIETDEACVHFLNVVPITREEKDLRQISAILDRLDGIDLFEPR